LPYAEEAVALARRVSSLAASWGPLQNLGRAYLTLGRRQEAEAVLRDSIDNVDKWNAQVDGGDSLGLQFFDLTGYPYYVLMEMKIQDDDAETALQLSERAKARHLADVLTYGRAKARHGEAPPIHLAQIQDLLPDNRTLLVEYAVLEHEVAVFTVVRGESRPSLSLARIAISSAELGRRVHAFHDELASRSPTYRDAARSLYSLLLAPVRARLAGKTHVVIVPDGPLWDLPFHALVDENGRHAIERFAVSYAPSLTVLRAGLRAEPVNHKLLAMGSPRGDLPNAAAEVRELGRLYGAAHATVLTGTAASRARWKEDAPRNGILHLATHGVLNNENPLYSYLELNGGTLEARDVLALDLHASLVVLSACETARGELHSGEGVVGMAWAMMIAGAPSVVVSQWKVDSTGTTQLMVAFHRQLQADALKSKSTALRSAALALMRRPAYRHPFYWAGFELLGDGY
jgi:CHAT domain-containing protein